MSSRDLKGDDFLKILALVAAGYLSYKVIKTLLDEDDKKWKDRKLRR